jgi:CRISPR type I-E-associated protein CasB/Cse2
MPDSTQNPTKIYPIDRLVRLLVEKAEPSQGKPGDRGTLAALRAWSRDASKHLAFAPMADLLNHSGAGVQRLDDPVWTAIPALFAWHRRHTPNPRHNFGVTCRNLAGDRREAFDAHFRRILACDSFDNLLGLLPTYVRRAEAASEPINFTLLFWDLTQWRKSPEGARAIKVRWAKQYYQVPAEEPTFEAP